MTTQLARFLPYNSLMKSVQRKVSGYGKTPTATAKTIFIPPEVVHSPSLMNRVIPRILSIARVPRNSPASTR